MENSTLHETFFLDPKANEFIQNIRYCSYEELYAKGQSLSECLNQIPDAIDGKMFSEKDKLDFILDKFFCYKEPVYDSEKIYFLRPNGSIQKKVITINGIANSSPFINPFFLKNDVIFFSTKNKANQAKNNNEPFFNNNSKQLKSNQMANNLTAEQQAKADKIVKNLQYLNCNENFIRPQVEKNLAEGRYPMTIVDNSFSKKVKYHFDVKDSSNGNPVITAKAWIPSKDNTIENCATFPLKGVIPTKEQMENFLELHPILLKGHAVYDKEKSEVNGKMIHKQIGKEDSYVQLKEKITNWEDSTKLNSHIHQLNVKYAKIDQFFGVQFTAKESYILNSGGVLPKVENCVDLKTGNYCDVTNLRLKLTTTEGADGKTYTNLKTSYKEMVNKNTPAPDELIEKVKAYYSKTKDQSANEQSAKIDSSAKTDSDDDMKQDKKKRKKIAIS